MDKTKVKPYLLFAGIGLIVLIPLVNIIYNSIKDKRLYEEGLKINAIIKDKDRSRNPRTRTFNYAVTLDYKDGNGKSHIEELQVDYETYRANQVGKTIEILIDKENPTSITLVDAAKFYDTEERVVSPKDLKDFYDSQDKEYILSKLNKISIGWIIQESDSNTFMNEKRKSFIKLTGDSITYFGNLQYREEIKQYLKGLKTSGYGKFDPGYLTDIPFAKYPEPRQKSRGPRMFDKYQYDDYELLYFNQVDYSLKNWVILSARKIPNKP
ncbi:MAG TPA: hypothetical protein PKL31_15540 [Fulvivirga sp.]|nr:hypothetical protein [Fulvivirga sp.]